LGINMYSLHNYAHKSTYTRTPEEVY